MAFVAWLEPELEQQLNQLAQPLGQSHRSGLNEAIDQDVQRCGHNDEARRQSAVIAMHVQNKDWSEECPDWSDWTA